MIEPERILQPLDEAEPALRSLTQYETPTELAKAIETTRAAAFRAMRLLLRSDTAAPEALRLSALSPADLPNDRLVEALRQRGLISLELGGTLHELEHAAARVARGDIRAADADAARRAAELTRSEVYASADRPVRRAASAAVATKALDNEAHAVPTPEETRSGLPWLLLGLAAVAVACVMWAVMLLVPNESDLEEGIAAFRADRLDQAEGKFRSVVEDEPEHLNGWLYLARVHRRQGRYDAAADDLRRASRLAPRDPGVARELGYLLLDLGRPRPAAGYFQRATEIDSEDTKNWIGWVRALRAAGDSAGAEAALARAPADARAALTSTTRAAPRPGAAGEPTSNPRR